MSSFWSSIAVSIITVASIGFAFRDTLHDHINQMRKEYEQKHRNILGRLKIEVEDLLNTIMKEFDELNNSASDSPKKDSEHKFTRFFTPVPELDEKISRLYKKLQKFYNYHYALSDATKKTREYKNKIVITLVPSVILSFAFSFFLEETTVSAFQLDWTQWLQLTLGILIGAGYILALGFLIILSIRADRYHDDLIEQWEDENSMKEYDPRV